MGYSPLWGLCWCWKFTCRASRDQMYPQPWSEALVPLALNSVIFWQDIFDHLDVALYSCGSEGNSKSVQLSCLAPATPG